MPPPSGVPPLGHGGPQPAGPPGSAAAAALTCPFCAAPLPPDGGESAQRVSCGNCGRDMVLAALQQAAEYRRNAEQARIYARHTEDVARTAALEARQAAADADAWARAAQAAEHRSRQLAVPTTLPAHPGTAVPLHPGAGPPSATQPTAADRRRQGVPTALLLQGTGALMILGAAVLISAVAWTFLPPVGQGLLLVAMVFGLGSIAVMIKHRLPTTSTILAALTAAVEVVVAVGLPAVIPGLELRTYAVAAAATVTVSLLLAGRASGIGLWRHLGWASAPVSAAVIVYALLSPWDASTVTSSLAAMMLAAAATGLLWSAARQHDNDAETAVTALWSGMAATGVAALAGAAAVGWTAVELSRLDEAARLWTAAAVVAVAAAAWVGVGVAGRFGWGMPDAAAGWPWAMPPLATAVIAAPATVPDQASALVLPAVLLLELGAAAALLVRGDRGAIGRTAGTGILIGALAWTPLWLLATAPFLSSRGAWFWLNDLLVALVIGAALLSWGAYRRAGAAVFAGTGTMVVAWGAAWGADHLGDANEALTLPVLSVLLVGTYAGTRRAGWRPPALFPQIMTIALTLPTFIPLLGTYVDTGRVAPWRAAVLAGLLAVAAVIGWRVRGGRTTAAAATAAVVVGFTEATLHLDEVDLPEAYTAVVAAALAAVAVAVRTEGLIRRPAAPAAVGITAVMVPSYLLALADPTFTGEWSAVRGATLIGAFAGLTALLDRRHPRAALLTGLSGLGLLAWWWGWFIVDSAAAGVVEAWTVRWAVLAAAGFGLYRHLFGPVGWSRWTILAPFGLIVVLPSYLAALVDPEFDLDGAAVRGASLVVLGGITAAAAWRRPAIAAAAATAALVLIGWWWGFWVASSQYSAIVEVWTIPWALLATAIVALWLRTGSAPLSQRLPILLAPAGAALSISAVVAVLEPLGSGGPGADIRVAAMLAVMWLLPVLLRPHARLVALTGTAAVAMTWYQLITVAGSRYPDPALEIYTWSGALALAAVAALVIRAAPNPINTLFTIGPPVSLALIPTAMLAWSTGELNWRVWVVLVAAGAALVAGVHLKWAGAVYPSLVALAAVVIPVLAHWAQDVPAYVPLTIVGAALLVVGARLEAVRRQGRHFTHWNSQLH